uniref:UMA domain-containing protein n=1 Tax=Timema douglasi TaxID=61478 RepID=A0A7R8ZEC1_TIMDO|nr:unnamed protein product [Timema douglasi]
MRDIITDCQGINRLSLFFHILPILSKYVTPAYQSIYPGIDKITVKHLKPGHDSWLNFYEGRKSPSTQVPHQGSDEMKTPQCQLANALVVLSSTAEDEDIEVRISVGSDYPVTMSFSWFSGRNKSPDRESSEGENSNADVNDQDDAFVFIERKQNLPPNNSELYPNLLPYPLAPTTATQPQTVERDSNTTGNIQTQNFLSGVPFKLSSSALYNLQPSTFEADQASQLLERLKVAEFDYDFSVENSVLMEESSKDLD